VDTIVFPVLQFRRTTIATVGSLEKLTRLSRIGIKKRLLDDVELVDHAGSSIRIVSAEPIHMLPPRLAMGEFIGYATGNPRYKMKLHFAEDSFKPVSLEQVKAKVRRSFSKDPWWEGLLDFEEFRQAVENASSVTEIIDVFEQYKQ